MSVTGVFIIVKNFILMELCKPKIVTWHSYVKPPGQVFTEPSLTQPDQSLSLKTLISRMVRGQDVTSHQPVFTDDPMMMEIAKMDAVERTQMAREVRSYVRKGVAPPPDPDPVPAPPAPDPVPDPAPPTPSGG